uniref:AAA_12 domain-containing protein n=1 Tax=Strongyloides papillosus TaxID=174720 RepID=A0A0N5BR73_STREA
LLAGTRKTQSICSALLTGITYGKRYLVVGPTNKACDAILERLFTWDPETNMVLSIKSKSAMVRYPDTHNRSELYYFRHGLERIKDKMEKIDRDKLQLYQSNKASYGSLKANVTDLNEDYFKNLNDAKSRLKNTETKLPSLIMKYINPKIFVCTIDLLIGGIPKAYTENGFDHKIVDEASQVRTSTAILLLSKFPTSNANYRSHPQLVALLSDLFYDGAQYPIRQHYDIDFSWIKLVKHNQHRLSPIYPYYLFHINYPSETHHSGSTYNPKEALDISIFLLYFFTIDYNPDDLATVSMYKAQVNQIHRSAMTLLNRYEYYLKSNNMSSHLIDHKKYTFEDYKTKLIVDTVDGFQGHEKKILIISTTRSTARPDDHETEFYRLRNRICVALTRPNLAFFLFGDISLMKKCDTWGSLAKRMEKEKTVIPFDKTTLANIFFRRGPLSNFINYYFNLRDLKEFLY